MSVPDLPSGGTSRRSGARALGFAMTWLITVSGCGHPEDARSPDRWNVVLVTLDTVRADALGSYGQGLPTSPELDRMAREGVLFEDVTTAAPHTVSSHASIMTGLYPFAHGARANHGFPLSAEHETLAEILGAGGHRTRAEIASHVLNASTRIAQGFESDSPEAEPSDGPAPQTSRGGLRRRAENVTDHAIATIRRWRDVPFFLWLHYFDAHLPYLERPDDRASFPGEPYLAQIHAIDRALGRVRAAIEEAGLRKNTLVVVTSDHGEGLGEHGEPTHSYFVYDSTMRVPLILWGPERLPRGRRVASVARTVDILPTVLDLMGRPVPAGIHGQSLVTAIDERKIRERIPLDGSAYGETLDLHRVFGSTPVRLIREGRWKYIHSADPELYDVVADPGEQRDRIADQPEIAKSLLARMRALVASAEIAEPSNATAAAISDVDVARLEALGYLIPKASPRLPAESELFEARGPSPRALAARAEAVSRAKGSISARRYGRAIERLAPITEAHPESATVLSMLAEAHAGAGDEELALELFQRATRVDADPCSETALDLARALDRFGRRRAQIEVLENALAACEESPTYLNELAWVLATTPSEEGGDGPRALELATSLMDLGAGEPDPNQLDTLAAAWFAAGDPARAAAVQRRALEILSRVGAPERVREAYAATSERYQRAALSLPSAPE